MNPDHRALVDQLRTSATALERAVATVPPGRHGRRPRENEWSVQETLVHLRNVALMVHGLRIRRLLYEPDPVFADYDEAAARQEDLAKDEPIGQLVRMIVAEHGQIADLLATLPDDRWSRQGRHPELGAMSIEFLARRVGEHGDEHARQIADTARMV
jgi:hypothetical protein